MAYQELCIRARRHFPPPECHSERSEGTGHDKDKNTHTVLRQFPHCVQNDTRVGENRDFHMRSGLGKWERGVLHKKKPTVQVYT